MIDSIAVRNFKCFKDETMELSSLNLLLGVNSGGKSTVIQAILLYDEARRKAEKNEALLNLLDTKYGVTLYSFEEILNQDSDEELFTIEIEEKGLKKVMVCSGTEDANGIFCRFSGEDSSHTYKNIYYFSSDRRITPYQRKGEMTQRTLGKEQQYLAYLIDKGKTSKIEIDERRNPPGQTVSLFDMQMNSWLDCILPGNRVEVLPSGNDGLLTLLLGSGGERHITNVGFGVSFILPIIAGGLLARKGDLLIVENPELHLHPKAQTEMAGFLSVVAAAGVQVIVETHSDHIVNGVRKACLKKDNPIGCSSVLMYFFNQEEEKRAEKIELDEMAEICKWPDGFLDQTETDLYEMRMMRKHLYESRDGNKYQ